MKISKHKRYFREGLHSQLVQGNHCDQESKKHEHTLLVISSTKEL